MECLRSMDSTTLQTADAVLSPFPCANENPNWYFLPVIDGGFSPKDLYSLFEQGTFIKVPSIVGDDTDEGTSFAANASTSDEFLDFIKSNYPHLTNSDLQSINESYPLMPSLPEHGAWFPSASAAYGEATFTCPGLEISSSFAQYFSADLTWNYRYDVIDWDDVQQGLGVPHVSEKPAIFGPGHSNLCSGGCSYETYNAAIVPIMMDYWISFIITLDPNSYKNPAAPQWEAFGSGAGQRLRFQTNASAMESVPSDQNDRCAMWKKLAPTSEQ